MGRSRESGLKAKGAKMAVGGRGGEFYIENAEIMERIAPEKS